MTKMNIANFAITDRQVCLAFRISCLIALLLTSTNTGKAQVVVAAGEKPGAVLAAGPAPLLANETTRVSSRRTLFQVPQDPQSQETNPSDNGSPSQEGTGTDDSIVQGMSRIPRKDTDLEIEVEPVNISTETVGKSQKGRLPRDVAAERARPSSTLQDGQARGFSVQQVNWAPANITHMPLYFEDAMLERHGHVRWGCAQPIVSGARFLTTLPLLPYLKTMQPPCEPRYTLGHFRAGSCAPALKDHLPWDRRAAVVETASLGAFFWAVPL